MSPSSLSLNFDNEKMKPLLALKTTKSTWV